MDCGETLPPDFFRKKNGANDAAKPADDEQPDPEAKPAETAKKPGRKKVAK